MVDSNDIDEIRKKYKTKLNKEFGQNYGVDIGEAVKKQNIETREYKQFKNDMAPLKMSLYEKGCQLSDDILKIKPDPKEAILLQEAIDTCHLQVTPSGTKSFAILMPIIIVLVGVIFSLILPTIIGADVGTFGIVMFVITGFSVYAILNQYPYFLANNWRMMATNEMVISIFYIVTYMRHTSNLENALVFASDHLNGPLALDLRKVIWDVQTQKYETLKVSLDNYLESWRKWNNEYVEAMHLIEASLYESSESRRVELLEKSLDVILEETYEKMLHYAHNLHSPITMLHMLGIILPILGLVLMPLIASFMTSAELPPDELAIYIAVFYNIALPLIVYYFGKTILASRPTGYGDTNIGNKKSFSDKQKVNFKIGEMNFSMTPMVIGVTIGMIGLFLALIPIFMHVTLGQDIVINQEGEVRTMHYNHEDYSSSKYYFLSYKNKEGSDDLIGPYGLGAAIFSLFLPLGLGLGLGLYYKLKTYKLMSMRNNTKKLENEFASSLFQLGNRLGDGMPAEIAFTKVSVVVKGSETGNFFQRVASNITRLGMSVKSAIFDSKIGAINDYPSNLIESSMKVLIESSRKGPKIAAQALLNISRYIKEIHRVNERLNDLMSEIISSMKSQISFLTPAIAGIVIGITSMVTYILIRLRGQLEAFGDDSQYAQFGGMINIFGDGIPTYFSQITVGLYVIQITYLLTVITNSIQNGSDKLNEEYELGNNLIKSTLLYVFISFTVMLLFNLIAGAIIPSGF
jgi:hypothetical protein